MIKAVVFDLDLTLANTFAGEKECINYALRSVGLPSADNAVIHECIGLSLPATIARIAGNAAPETVEKFTYHFTRRADEEMEKGTKIYDCAPSVIAALQSRGLALAILSSKPGDRIRRILTREGLHDSFTVIVGYEDVPHRKPSPHGLNLTVSRTRFQPTEVVYVGDHPLDAEAAQAAGVDFVASKREDFLKFRRLAVINNLTELPAHLGLVVHRPEGRVDCESRT